MTTVYSCAVCSGKNVEHASWVELNTQTVKEDFGSWCTDGNSWCNDCQDHTNIKMEKVEGLDPKELKRLAQSVADSFQSGGGGLILSVSGMEAERRLQELKIVLEAIRT